MSFLFGSLGGVAGVMLSHLLFFNKKVSYFLFFGLDGVLPPKIVFNPSFITLRSRVKSRWTIGVQNPKNTVPLRLNAMYNDG